ncbi:hypothetical protein GQR58_029136 [Nymphon striatum]|nr:hypothetical protein GQR58_029136 [Nymphon striatum]
MELRRAKALARESGDIMRLVCPNCDAEYQVDDSLIPAEGRDVQCSNCTTTWFQAAAEVVEDEKDQSSLEAEPQPVVAPSLEVEAETEGEKHEDADDLAVTAADDVPTPRKPSVDPEAMSIIHEEVERETAARKAEMEEQEAQIDPEPETTVVDEIVPETPNQDEQRQRMDMEAIEEPDDALSAAPKREDPNAKSELFPDIEEINSTLSPEAAEA